MLLLRIITNPFFSFWAVNQLFNAVFNIEVYLWIQPQVAVGGTAFFSTLCNFISLGGCCLRQG